MHKTALPIQAFWLLIRNRKLFLLAFLPGIITLLFSTLSLIIVWNLWLSSLSPWVAYPTAFLSFPLLWIAYGNLALLPVEDAIVDYVQKSVWGRIRVAARDFSPRRILRELMQSLGFALLLIVLLPLSLVPGFSFLTFLIASWWTAWCFVGPILNRRWNTFAEKRHAFQRHFLGNTVLGAGLNVLLFVPLLNVWLLGYALILATLVEIDRHGSGR